MKPSHRKLTRSCAIVFDSLPEEVCHSVGDVLARVGDKWSILVIHMLSRGRMRFSELKRALGSSRRRC